MKKIIYSLVIMIAAGSLFTSCIEQVEPAGILELRISKAEYIKALKDLRAADAELQRAYAAVQKALAAKTDAETAYQNAKTAWETEYQRLVNELKALEVDSASARLDSLKEVIAADLEKLEMTMEEERMKHDSTMLALEGALAQAEWDLEKAIRAIEAAAIGLTAEEKTVVLNTIFFYEQSIQAVIDATDALRDAEAQLWDLENNAWSVGDDGVAGYRSAGQKYAAYIQFYKDRIAFWQNAKEELSKSDLKTWYDEIVKMKKDSTEMAYNQYQVAQDSVKYMVNTFHDGEPQYQKAVKAWAAKNWKEVATPGLGTVEVDGKYYKEPVDGTAPGTEPKQSTYKYNTNADSLAIPNKSIKQSSDPKQFVIWKKFADLIGEYDDLQVPYATATNYKESDGSSYTTVSFKNTTQKMATLTTEDADTYTLHINAIPTMYNFVFGNTTGQPVKWAYKTKTGEADPVDVEATAAYGIDGAISILERDLVLAEEALDIETLEKNYKKADSTWRADRAILLAGLAAYKPYTDAVAELEAAEEKADENGGKMVEAINKALTQINSVNHQTGTPKVYSQNDTAEIIDAFVKFAQAREAYLDYTPAEGDPDLRLFNYASASNPVEAATIAYTAMTIDGFKPQDRTSTFGQVGKFGFDAVTGKVEAPNGWCAGANVPVYPADEYHYTFGAVAAQLFNEHVAFMITAEMEIPESAFEYRINADGNQALYGKYAYHAATTTDPAWIEVVATGEKYVPKEVTDAKAKVQAAIDAYVEIYKNYWNVPAYVATLTPASTADDIADARKLEWSVGIYSEKTFTEPYNMVSFMSDKVIYNNGLGAILSLIEPDPAIKTLRPNQQNWKNADLTLKDSHIFGANDGDPAKMTTYAKYLLAKEKYENHGAIEAYKTALEAIKFWAESVRTIFQTAIDKNGTDNTNAYNKAHSAWQTKKDNYDKDHAAYTTYIEAKKAFTGLKEDGKTPNDICWTIAAPVAYTAAQVTMTETGFKVYEGKWNIAGEQATLAEKYLPKYPEMVAAIRGAHELYEDHITHYQTLIDVLTKAYLKAASLYDAAAEANFAKGQPQFPQAATADDLKVFYESIIAWYDGQIYNAQNQILVNEHALAKWEAGYDAEQIAIEKKKEEIELLKQKLIDAEAKLAYWEAQYKAVMDKYMPAE